jgi:hypothetical protein
MRIHAIGHISELAEDTSRSPLATIPLSQQLKIEREILFGNRPKKPRGKIKQLTNAELYAIAERVAIVTAKAYNIEATQIFTGQGLPRYLTITICYLHSGFTKKDCAFIFNSGNQLPIIAARVVENRAILDQDFRQIYRTLIKESKHE